ncbi:MAG: hypothetical protein GY928_22985 [Colwellia sp.]|nr:hypothetical protein [Colwellia sp.]
MQPVNVLPTFVSQDADLKNKETSGASKGNSEAADFSHLVDKHIDEELTVITPKEAKSSLEPTTATNGKAIAENGKDDEQRQDPSQESESKIDASPNTAKNSENKTVELLAKENKEKLVKLDESEQFISLLYNSDLTLTGSDEATKSPEQATQVIDSKEGTPDALVNKKESTIGAQSNNNSGSQGSAESSLANERNSSVLSVDHKLKVFSNDAAFASAKFKSDVVITKQPSEPALKDYQQLIQSKQGQLDNQNITSELLTKAVLDGNKLEGNKISNIATSVAQANNNLLNENVDTGLYQRPVEPIREEKSIINDLAPLSKELMAKLGEQENGKVSEQLTKPLTDLKPQSNEGFASSDTKLLNKVAELVNTKVNSGEVNSSQVHSEKSNSGLSQTDLEKVKVERNALQGVMGEASVKVQAADVKVQPLDAQSKPGVIITAQTQVAQQLQTEHKDKSAKNDLHSSEDTMAEYDYADSLNISEKKPNEQGINTSNKALNNLIARSTSEIQSQVIQANQIKQSSDAYIEHQASEVLNHNVASDTAQIQKNNVQLQQEVISIFKKDFADAVKDKVMVMINQKLQQFDITLDPPEFGNMQVRVNLQGEQAAVNFVVQNQQAKDALEQNMHKLRDMLSEQGVDVGGANVEQQDQQQSNDESGLGQEENNSSMLSNQEEISSADNVLSAKLFDSSAAGVDYYA